MASSTVPASLPTGSKVPNPEYQEIKAQWDKAEALRKQERLGDALGAGAGLSKREEMMRAARESDERRSKIKEGEFKTAHFGIMAILGWIFLVHVAGIYFFTKGFLLTRLVLDNQSQCDVLPFEEHAMASSTQYEAGSPDGCWHPRTFNKAVVIIIDALRYDFTVPFRPTVEGEKPQIFHDNIPVLYETAVESPEKAFLLPFIADPPTTTLQRLKGLTTGTLPAFVDAGSNFAGTAIEEDNLVAQLRDAGKKLVHLGDDTWHSLFPDYFDANLTHAYDSFNVWDLYTVDNGVTEHLFPLLHRDNASKWDVIFGHYLGVDHAGHRYGPDHASMASKLREMNQVIKNVMDRLDDDTLFVVLGDHGMDAKGDHGGESDDEVEAALWMYSKKGIFGRTDPDFVEPPRHAKQRPIPQIDLVPTLSLLLGMPIPFNNLGAPINEAFAGKNGKDMKNLATVNRLASAQIKRYQHEYAIARGIQQSQTSGPLSLWVEAEKSWAAVAGKRNPDSSVLRSVYEAYREYERDTLNVCRGLWARFDIPSMIQGITILFAGIFYLVLYARSLRCDQTDLTVPSLKRIGMGSAVGGAAGLLSVLIGEASYIERGILGACVGSILSVVSVFTDSRNILSSPLPNTTWGWMAVIFTVSQSIGFASNSYTIWEDEILLFFLTTFGVMSGISSMRQKATADRVLGMYHSIVFVILGRVASLSRLCREEQMPFCRSTYYASATSSTSAPWQLSIPFLLALFLPSVIKSYYQGSKSYEGSATLWIGFAFRMGLLLVALFWTLEAADNGEWFGMDKGLLKSARVALAQLVFGVAFAAGTTTFGWAKPCVNIAVTPEPAPTSPTGSPIPQIGPPRTSVTILGYGNVHGTRFFFLLVNFCLAIALMQKPMGAGAVGIEIWQILSLMEILDTNGLSTSNSAIGPVILGLLGSFHYFKTGHQATLSSIQWDSAFVALKTIRYPWSPLLVVLNTFGAQILAAVAVPLIVLWKRPIDTRGGLLRTSLNIHSNDKSAAGSSMRLLSDVTKAAATHILYYATVNLATTMWAGWLRRHLMLYRIFCPRFMMGAAVLGVVDLVVAAVAVLGVRWSTMSVAEVFGW